MRLFEVHVTEDDITFHTFDHSTETLLKRLNRDLLSYTCVVKELFPVSADTPLELAVRCDPRLV